MKRFRLERVPQTPKACGPASLVQVLRYYGVDIDLPRMLSLLDIPEEEFSRQGVAEGSLGLAAARLGFRVTFLSFDTKRFDPTWSSLSKDEVLSLLRHRLSFLESASADDEKEGYASYYKLVTTRRLVELFEHPLVGFSFRPISESLLCSLLDKGVLPLVIVNSPLFFRTPRRYRGEFDEVRGREWGHVVTVAGYDEKRFWIVDPAQGSRGKYWLRKDFLLNVLLQYGPNVVVVYPEK